MSRSEAFVALFDRMPELMRDAVGDLSADDLARRPAPHANTMAWMLWHLARVEDDHVSSAAAALGKSANTEQTYVADGFADRFALPFPVEVHGFGMSVEDVGRVRAEPELLIEYYDAVHAKTLAFLDDVAEGEWDTIVDDSWDPPVTLFSRITSVANEVTQHVGQAAYVRGLLGS